MEEVSAPAEEAIRSSLRTAQQMGWLGGEQNVVITKECWLWGSATSFPPQGLQLKPGMIVDWAWIPAREAGSLGR